MMLRNKVAIVTGASSGIGRATALLMAREGAAVVLADVDTKAGEAAAQEIRGSGGKAAFQATDVTDEGAVAALVKRAEDEFGGLDIAYNNAGVEGPQALFETQDFAKVRRAFDVLIDGVYLCMQHEIRAMLKRGGGSIVNASSIWGLNAWPEWSPYIASKHAVSGMTKTAALELAKRNIRVNAVAPGPVLTPLLLRGWKNDAEKAAGRVPMGRIGRPEEIAEAVVWLASERASFVNGHILPVDGGMMGAVG
ncbi:MAG: SDR family NAD(P)-dependent oxidoreductase [Alphaproteobacteria bacterium]